LEKRRVVVTGVGLVTALGTGTEETWKGLCEGRSGVGPISRFDTSLYSTRIAAEVKDFDPLRWFDKKDVKKMDYFIHYAVAAADFAMKQSGLTIAPDMAERAGVFIGSGIGGFTVIEREHRVLLESGPRKISPFFIPSSIINLAAGQVSIRFGARGPNSAPCTAWPARRSETARRSTSSRCCSRRALSRARSTARRCRIAMSRRAPAERGHAGP